MRVGLLFWIFLICGVGLATAQSVITERGQAAVRVTNENYVRARETAVAVAKKDILTRTLTEFLRPEDVEQLYPVLENRLLNEPDAFIESTRVIEEVADEQAQEYFLVMEARLYRSRIVNGLQQLAIPLRNDLTRALPVRLRYAEAEWFVQANQETLLRSALKRRLAAYHVELLEEPASNLTTEPVLELSFSKNANQLLQTNFSSTTVGVQLQLQYQGQTLEEVYAQRPLSNRNSGFVIAVLLDQLMLNWSPVIREIRRLEQKDDGQLRLEVLEAPSAIAEDELLQVAEQNIGWSQPILYQLTANSIVYQGQPTRSRSEVAESLRQLRESNFQTQALALIKDTLYWRLEWTEPVRSLLRSTEDPPGWDGGGAPVSWKVPETSPGLYQLPLEEWVYGEIPNRGGSHWLQLELPGDSESAWKVRWQVLGTTKLRPEILVFDDQRNRVQQQSMIKSGSISIDYAYQEKEKKLFLRISDEIGYIKSAVGGYQSFRYALRIEKK